jgi:hypothetical protein
MFAPVKAACSTFAMAFSMFSVWFLVQAIWIMAN